MSNLAQTIKTLRAAFYRLLEVILVLTMIVMFVLVFTNVMLRIFLNTGIDFAEEVPRFAFIWMTFIGAIIGMHKHTHLGVDMLVAVLPVLGRKICWGISQFIMVVCSLYMLYGTWLQHEIIASNASAVLQLSMLWVYGVSYLTGVAITFICLANLVRLVLGQVDESELVDVQEEGIEDARATEMEMKEQVHREGGKA